MSKIKFDVEYVPHLDVFNLHCGGHRRHWGTRSSLSTQVLLALHRTPLHAGRERRTKLFIRFEKNKNFIWSYIFIYIYIKYHICIWKNIQLIHMKLVIKYHIVYFHWENIWVKLLIFWVKIVPKLTHFEQINILNNLIWVILTQIFFSVNSH